MSQTAGEADGAAGAPADADLAEQGAGPAGQRADDPVSGEEDGATPSDNGSDQQGGDGSASGEQASTAPDGDQGVVQGSSSTGQASSGATGDAQSAQSGADADAPAVEPTPHENGMPAGLDVTLYVAHSDLQQRMPDDPQVWAHADVPSPAATASRVVVSFERIPADELAANAYQAFVRLPDNADCTALLASQPYALTSGEEGAAACGTYTYACDDSGAWYAVLAIIPSFVTGSVYEDPASGSLVLDAVFACAVAWDADFLAGLGEPADGALAAEAAPASGDVATLSGSLSVKGVQGWDLGDHINGVHIQKKVGAVWEDATEFTDDDQVHVLISYTGVSEKDLQENGYRGYIKVPDCADCGKFVGQSFPMYDGSTQSGTYTYVQGADGAWYMELNYFPDYVDSAENAIGGRLQFDFNWKDDASSDEGKENVVKIGDWEGTVVVKKTHTDQGDSDGKNLSIKKTAGALSYSQDGSVVYVDYTVEVSVSSETAGPIELADILTGAGFSYDEGSLGITGADGVTCPSVSWEANQVRSDGACTASISIGAKGETIAPGAYTLTYRVQSTEAAKAGVATDAELSNKVSARDGDEDLSSETHTKTSTGGVTKQGSYAEGDDGASYIDWTVCLNAGDIVKNLTEPASFTDSLPEGLGLVGDVTVSRYTPDGTLVDQTAATVSEDGTISYTTPTGQYYYVISYRTKVTSDVPLGGTTVENTAHSEGGVAGDSTGKVTVPNRGVEKKFDAQDVTQRDGSWLDVIEWTAHISVAGSLKGYVYEDYAQPVWDAASGAAVNVVSMTAEQLANIVVLDAEGNPVDPGRYTVLPSDHVENGVACGLFKIAFGDDVVGPLSITYQTTADLDGFDVGAYVNFTNWGLLTDGAGHSDSSSATSSTIHYTHGDSGVIHKYGGSWTVSDGSSYQLKPGETSIPWTIAVNNDQKLSGDLTVTDTVAQGMEFDPASLAVSIWGNSIVDQVVWEYDTVTRTLTVHIPESAYVANGASLPVVISYRTELDRDFLAGGEESRDFTNSAHIDYADGSQDSTHTQTVTKQAVAKTGRFDAKNDLLIYEIVLNPYAERLNGGAPLTVSDTLDAGALASTVRLSSLTLYTAVRQTASDGTAKVVPGRLVQELQEGDGVQELTYRYDDATKTFVACVPDATAYVLVATYALDKTPAEDVPMKNTVQLSGTKSWSASDSSTKAEHHTSGETYVGTHRLTVVKHDASQFNNVLSGAQFRLERYDATTKTWTAAVTLTTGADGSASTGVDPNVLYRLTEQAAPQGYLLDPTPLYFVVRDASVAAVPALPDAVEGDAEYGPDKVVVREVHSEEGATVVLDRYDDRDNTVVETGQVRVLKTWKDASGATVDDPVKLASLPQVNVTLTKHALGNTVTIKDGDSSWAHALVVKTTKAGQSIQWQGLASWQKDAVEADLTAAALAHEWSASSDGSWVLTLGPVTQDCTVISGSLAWMNACTLVGGTDGAATDTVVGTATLSAANDWTYVWDGLDTGKGVTYTVSESAPDGYQATYTVAGTELAAGEVPTFALGEGGILVGVSNVPTDKPWELPETGGAGVKLFISSGLALVASAFACGFARRFHRERRRV